MHAHWRLLILFRSNISVRIVLLSADAVVSKHAVDEAGLDITFVRLQDALTGTSAILGADAEVAGKTMLFFHVSDAGFLLVGSISHSDDH